MIFWIAFVTYLVGAERFSRALIDMEGAPEGAGDVVRLFFCAAAWPVLWSALIWLRGRK